MPKNNDKGMIRNPEPFKKKIVRHLLVPKSKFDFVEITQTAKAGSKRKKLRVKSITPSLKF